LSFPRAPRPSGMRCSRLSTFAFITPRSASVTCRFCPGRRRSPPRRYIAQDIRARSGCGSRRRSARAELGDAALELVRPSYVIATSAWWKEGAARPTAHIKALHRRPANCPPR
jgi:hypothetical protein